MEDRLHAPLSFLRPSFQRVACPGSGRYSAGMARRLLIGFLVYAPARAGLPWRSPSSRPAPADTPGQAPGPTVPMTVLADQLVDLFPKVEGDVLEVQDGHAHPRGGAQGWCPSRARPGAVSRGPGDQAPQDRPGAGPLRDGPGARDPHRGRGAVLARHRHRHRPDRGGGPLPALVRQDPARAAAPGRGRPRQPHRGHHPGAGRAAQWLRPLRGEHGRFRSTPTWPRRGSRARSSWTGRA